MIPHSTTWLIQQKKNEIRRFRPCRLTRLRSRLRLVTSGSMSHGRLSLSSRPGLVDTSQRAGAESRPGELSSSSRSQTTSTSMSTRLLTPPSSLLSLLGRAGRGNTEVRAVAEVDLDTDTPRGLSAWRPFSGRIRRGLWAAPHRPVRSSQTSL